MEAREGEEPTKETSMERVATEIEGDNEKVASPKPRDRRDRSALADVGMAQVGGNGEPATGFSNEQLAREPDRGCSVGMMGTKSLI